MGNCSVKTPYNYFKVYCEVQLLMSVAEPCNVCIEVAQIAVSSNT